MKFQIQNLIYFCLILFFVYIFTVNMKIIEGNTGDGSSSSTNDAVLTMLERLQDQVKKIQNKVQA
jgi:hypothetical protein